MREIIEDMYRTNWDIEHTFTSFCTWIFLNAKMWWVPRQEDYKECFKFFKEIILNSKQKND